VIISTRRSNPKILLLFCLLAVILRFFSFFPSVIDHDESTYLEIARMLLNGKTLYVDMVDIKPPGIFLILAGFQGIIGNSIFEIRILVAIWITLTAFILYKSALIMTRDERAAVASGIIYIFFISTWSFYGISITPEIFFNLFTISALYVLLKSEKPAQYFWAGLLAGIGFIIKYLVLFDFAAYILFLTFFPIENRKSKIENRILYLSISAIAFLLPFGITNLWFYLNGHFDAFYNITYLAPSKYPAEFDPWKMLKFLIDFHLRFLPFFIFYYYALFHKGFSSSALSMTRKLGIVWSLMALVAVLLAGKTFGHYMIQLMLPVSLVAGVFFAKREATSRLERFLHSKTALVAFMVLILGISAMKIEYIIKKDVPREIADYLEPKLKPEDVIYTGNYHHIIYYLMKKDSPTKYIHRSLLTAEHHIHALDIDAKEEFEKIMAQRPVYIIIKKEYPVKMMQDFIRQNYVLEKEFEGEVFLYRIKEN
jgi:4-amino-4-deoxy-L-arabinose transferase-like glycosyltransferase